MSKEYQEQYTAEILHAYEEVRQFVDIGIELFVTEYWAKGVQAHIEGSFEKNQALAAENPEQALSEYRKKMDRIAISTVSRLLANRSHEECRKIMKNQNEIHSSLISALAQLPGCRDPIAFVKSHGVTEPADYHLANCREIGEAINAIWDVYKAKQLKTHKADKFRTFFEKRISQPVAFITAYQEKKLNHRESSMPGLSRQHTSSDMPALRKKTQSTEMPALGQKAGSLNTKTNIPGLLDFQSGVGSEYADMPGLRKFSQTSSVDSVNYDDMPPLQKKQQQTPSVSFDVGESDDDDMPSLRASTNSLQSSDVDSNMPPLHRRNNFSKVGDPERISSPSAMPSLGVSKRRATSVTDLIAVGWMEKYVQRNKSHLAEKNYIYFSPSNVRTERVIKSAEAVKHKGPFNPDIYVKTHLCVDPMPTLDITSKAFNPLRRDGTSDYLILINQEREIQIPSVDSPSLKEDGVVQIGDISVRVFVHDNIFNFTKK